MSIKNKRRAIPENNAHGQGGQGISGGKVRHVDVQWRTMAATPSRPPNAPQMDGSHLLASGVCLTAVAARQQIAVMQATDAMIKDAKFMSFSSYVFVV